MLEDRLRLALAVAERLEADIRVLAFRSAPPPSTLDRDFPGTGDANEMARIAWEQEEAALRGWRATYDRILCAHHGAAPVGWTDVYEPLSSTFPTYARACDVVVAGGRSSDPATSTLDDEISATALLESGRLALFAAHPTPEHPDPFARIMIAWDDGPAAARAIAQAIPMIAASASVRLLAVETDPRRAIPCNQILAYLRRHAPKTDVLVPSSIMHTVGHTILAQAESWGASLIVMGAYGHSRGREMIFGGATRFVIGHAKCPVLMTR